MTEFELIRRFFAAQPISRADVAIGVGDDGAVIACPPGQQLVVTTDTLVEGVHFFPESDPVALGHKALAVNLSDLAAMGAAPACFVLALSLPRADNNWLERLCEGIFGLARRYDVQLVGGDTVRGPLAVTITAHGWVPAGRALLRSGARVGDRIFVTGELGDAGIALRQEQGGLTLSQADSAIVTERLTRPMPRVEAGIALRGIASSAIDISDGLIGDLGHILEQSGVGARVELGRLPVSHVYRSLLPQIGWDVALANGDDYELCFTVPEANIGALKAATAALGYPVTHIGDVVAGEGLRLTDAGGKPYRPQTTAHDHFRAQ